LPIVPIAQILSFMCEQHSAIHIDETLKNTTSMFLISGASPFAAFLHLIYTKFQKWFVGKAQPRLF